LNSTIELVTHAPAETFELGTKLARSLAPPRTVALAGELGCGKTVFAKGFAAALGIAPDDVTSPTFTLVREHHGSATLHHVDAYRLSGEAEFSALGGDELVGGSDFVVIEWAERVAGVLPSDCVWVHFEHAGGDCRRIAVSGVRDVSCLRSGP